MSQNLLSLLTNAIDLIQVPYSDHGSRLMIFRDENDRFLVRLAERLTRIDPGIEAYLQRPPFIEQLCLIDENGAELPYQLTWNPYGVRLETTLGDFHLLIDSADRLVVGIPDGVFAGMRLQCNPQYYRETLADGSRDPVRELSYQIGGSIYLKRVWNEGESQWLELILAPGTNCAVELSASPESAAQASLILSPSAILAENMQRWQTWFERAPAVDDRFAKAYAYAWWNLANNLISPKGKILFESMMPSKVKYVGLWLWDCAMHAIALRHADPELARNQLRAMLAWQLEDGMLPDAIFDDGLISEIDFPIHGRVTKPPIFAWAALKIHEAAPDLNYLREIYPHLVRENRWWFEKNDDDQDGIPQYSHPYSSGLDDNPLWDYGMPVESPDLNTYLYLQMEALAQMADLLERPQEALLWRLRCDTVMEKMISYLWDEQAGVFQALQDHKPVPVLTPFHLFPLWTGKLPQPIRDRLIAHLTNPDEFWGVYALPTVAYNDPHFDAKHMWRGPVWTNINYFMIEALEKVGEAHLAAELREKTLNMIMAQDGMFEYYDAVNGVPPDEAARVFGWTAAVFVDLVIGGKQGADKQVKQG